MPKLKRWQVLDAVHDAAVVGFSLADIATDILVALEFRADGHATLWTVSAAIFALAQLSYAFLFVFVFAREWSACGRLALFFAVLPVAQLVPFFTWFESFHWPALDARLREAGLKPTAVAEVEAADRDDGTAEGEDDGGAAGEDFLFGYVRSKYQAHAGFIVEAFVEAVPQAVLQIIAVTRSGGLTDFGFDNPR